MEAGRSLDALIAEKVMGDEEWGCRFLLDKEYKAWGDSAPHAICLAALQAVEYRKM